MEKPERFNHLSVEDILAGCKVSTNGDENETRVCVAEEELRQALSFIKNYPKSVSVFGSARFKEGNEHYEQARNLSKKIVSETGHAVITGGGPGIMEAANRGAKEGEGKSIGLTIQLPFEQTTNPYTTDVIPFYYFFTRKVALAFSAECYIYFPGGFGTMDELFEILTLVQTGKIQKVPIVLVGKDFWEPLDSFIKQNLRDKEGTISPEDTDLYTITEDEEEIIEIIKNAPTRDE